MKHLGHLYLDGAEQIQQILSIIVMMNLKIKILRLKLIIHFSTFFYRLRSIISESSIISAIITHLT